MQVREWEMKEGQLVLWQSSPKPTMQVDWCTHDARTDSNARVVLQRNKRVEQECNTSAMVDVLG